MGNFRNDRDLQDKISLLLSKCSQDMINLSYLEDHIIYFSKDRYTKDGLNECELINNEPISHEQLKWLTAIQFSLLSSCTEIS